MEYVNLVKLSSSEKKELLRCFSQEKSENNFFSEDYRFYEKLNPEEVEEEIEWNEQKTVRSQVEDYLWNYIRENFPMESEGKYFYHSSFAADRRSSIFEKGLLTEQEPFWGGFEGIGKDLFFKDTPEGALYYWVLVAREKLQLGESVSYPDLYRVPKLDFIQPSEDEFRSKTNIPKKYIEFWDIHSETWRNLK